ncbi:hypothetical protein NC653_010033 [Populus alba x Populus x berolinensis]|uniref:Uncharacterized protein n=1 Tax=Populus alba x Populus x berolinensis TaxID=444605 RepID=A0AAD6RAJ9_9ROSI|nr:hypothetical protein NC653_010033 [Populus alba x Populus x berolinensis]
MTTAVLALQSQLGTTPGLAPTLGVKLFGVRLTDGSIRKKRASMGNLSPLLLGLTNVGWAPHFRSLNHPGSPGDTPDHGIAAATSGYASEGFSFPGSSSSRERKERSLVKVTWRWIARNYVISRTPTQVASSMLRNSSSGKATTQ